MHRPPFCAQRPSALHSCLQVSWNTVARSTQAPRSTSHLPRSVQASARWQSSVVAATQAWSTAAHLPSTRHQSLAKQFAFDPAMHPPSLAAVHLPCSRQLAVRLHEALGSHPACASRSQDTTPKIANCCRVLIETALVRPGAPSVPRRRLGSDGTRILAPPATPSTPARRSLPRLGPSCTTHRPSRGSERRGRSPRDGRRAASGCSSTPSRGGRS